MNLNYRLPLISTFASSVAIGGGESSDGNEAGSSPFQPASSRGKIVTKNISMLLRTDTLFVAFINDSQNENKEIVENDRLSHNNFNDMPLVPC